MIPTVIVILKVLIKTIPRQTPTAKNYTLILTCNGLLSHWPVLKPSTMIFILCHQKILPSDAYVHVHLVYLPGGPGAKLRLTIKIFARTLYLLPLASYNSEAKSDDYHIFFL